MQGGKHLDLSVYPSLDTIESGLSPDIIVSHSGPLLLCIAQILWRNAQHARAY
jgi:hypothetical protein